MKKINKQYWWKGNALYNVKRISGLNYLYHDIQADWRDKEDGNKEKFGKFYFKDLT